MIQDIIGIQGSVFSIGKASGIGALFTYATGQFTLGSVGAPLKFGLNMVTPGAWFHVPAQTETVPQMKFEAGVALSGDTGGGECYYDGYDLQFAHDDGGFSVIADTSTAQSLINKRYQAKGPLSFSANACTVYVSSGSKYFTGVFSQQGTVTVTLGTTNAVSGDIIEIYKVGNDYPLIVQGSQQAYIQSGYTGKAEFCYNGTAWMLANFQQNVV